MLALLAEILAVPPVSFKPKFPFGTGTRAT